MAGLRQQGRPDPYQPGRTQLPQRKERAAHLARGFQWARRNRMGQQPISFRSTHIQEGCADKVKQHGMLVDYHNHSVEFEGIVKEPG